VTIGDQDRILIKCRVGCPTDSVLDAIGLDWQDLFAPKDKDGLTMYESDELVDRRVEQSDLDICHRAYELLLRQLTLDETHRADLHRRGLSEAEIDKRGYRSLRNIDRGRAAKAVYQDLGDAVLAVPGFVCGEFGITIDGAATGLLIPVRDLQGLITALKIRRAGEPKYMYVTSGGDGPSPGSPIHVPLGVAAPATEVRVTEGELKSDVAFALDGTPTIGVPGVTQWQSALPALVSLGAKTVVLAYDAPDVKSKAPVLEQTERFYQELISLKYQVVLEDWDDN
jgi:hypothetical protein